MGKIRFYVAVVYCGVNGICGKIENICKKGALQNFMINTRIINIPVQGGGGGEG